METEDFRALSDRGVMLRRADRPEEAEAALRRALELCPDHPFPWLNLGNLMNDEGRLAEAEAAYRRALQANPAEPLALHALGLNLLAQGRYPEGWPLHEHRSHEREPRGPQLPLPEWDGGPLAGRKLVVWPEQGAGDMLMCARYLPLIEGDVTVVCPPQLADVLGGCGVTVLSRSATLALPGNAVAVWMFSLPARFGTTLATIPPPALITAEPRPARGRIGIAWRGDPRHPHDRHRSLPAELGAELLAIPGARSLHPEDTGAVTYLDTAELIAGLDLVVTVDTSIAHLAGSMGKPTWILLSDRGLDFRWMRGRVDTPWYPTARLVRQRAAGDWRSVLEAVKADLAT